jgi:hypothetical protein
MQQGQPAEEEFAAVLAAVLVAENRQPKTFAMKDDRRRWLYQARLENEV